MSNNKEILWYSKQRDLTSFYIRKGEKDRIQFKYYTREFNFLYTKSPVDNVKKFKLKVLTKAIKKSPTIPIRVQRQRKLNKLLQPKPRNILRNKQKCDIIIIIVFLNAILETIPKIDFIEKNSKKCKKKK